MWTCRSQNCTEVPLVKFQKPPGEMRGGCEAQPSSETFKIVICSGDCDCAGTPETPQPLSLSPTPDGLMLHEVRWGRVWVKIQLAFVKLYFLVSEQMQVFAQKHSILVLTCFLKREGVVMLEINKKAGGGEGKEVVHGLCCHQLPQHTCREKPTREACGCCSIPQLWLMQQ